ncbi:hypothetical protein Cgig2_029763 [Carnegiea gigantea]|uniref:Uncharacterized protein n=1 Tax=Carnegiea gigantea TaxID=171969 RepID=A0A9Q1K2V1_9CARY|nr:hypothetical protein Cgig2_029763 [Carnegiea gigantea]
MVVIVARSIKNNCKAHQHLKFDKSGVGTGGGSTEIAVMMGNDYVSMAMEEVDVVIVDNDTFMRKLAEDGKSAGGVKTKCSTMEMLTPTPQLGDFVSMAVNARERNPMTITGETSAPIGPNGTPVTLEEKYQSLKLAKKSPPSEEVDSLFLEVVGGWSNKLKSSKER